MMKKIAIMSMGAVLLLSGCGTYAGSGNGVYMGATLGSIFGSAIGGISGGPRGSDIGTLVGMATGAVAGGVIEQQAVKQQMAQDAADGGSDFSRRYQQHREAATNRGYSDGGDHSGCGDNDSGFDPEGKGDDTLYDFQGPDYTGSYSATKPENVSSEGRDYSFSNMPAHSEMPLEIRNARFVDDNEDCKLNGGETGKVIFEVYNTSQEPVYDVQPMVVETSGKKHIMVSNTIHVEKISPGHGIRYTAMVKAGKRLKDGRATFHIYAVRGNNVEASGISEFNVLTSRK